MTGCQQGNAACIGRCCRPAMGRENETGERRAVASRDAARRALGAGQDEGRSQRPGGTSRRGRSGPRTISPTRGCCWGQLAAVGPRGREWLSTCHCGCVVGLWSWCRLGQGHCWASRLPGNPLAAARLTNGRATLGPDTRPQVSGPRAQGTGPGHLQHVLQWFLAEPHRLLHLWLIDLLIY